MRYLLAGQTLALDVARCNGCGRCEEVCPHGVFALSARKAMIADRAACMECGACRLNCPTGAIAVSSGVGCAAAILSSLAAGKGDQAPECSCG